MKWPKKRYIMGSPSVPHPLSSTHKLYTKRPLLFSLKNLPHERRLSSTQKPSQFHIKNPSELKRVLNWGVFGVELREFFVELRGLRCWTERVLNWGLLVWNWGEGGTEGFWCETVGFRCWTERFLVWKGVVVVWNRCVELRGSVLNWRALFYCIASSIFLDLQILSQIKKLKCFKQLNVFVPTILELTQMLSLFSFFLYFISCF